jgi:nitroimidazol reductase NimA-like FMN-containing flavoprotein (pyridoxamine 5'-phosphate oxidase superfamily)
MKLSKKVSKLIARERVCRVATAGEDDNPHVVPVCHVLAGEKIYFGSGTDARKVANLRKNPQIALTVDLYSEEWSQLRGVTVQGTATLISAGPASSKSGPASTRSIPNTPRTRRSPRPTRSSSR